jgi:hypothetical protein
VRIRWWAKTWDGIVRGPQLTANWRCAPTTICTHPVLLTPTLVTRLLDSNSRVRLCRRPGCFEDRATLQDREPLMVNGES